MPYASEKQSRFMHSQHPDVAARWDKEERKGGKRKKKSRRMKGRK
jgi:hypothetical protein